MELLMALLFITIVVGGFFVFRAGGNFHNEEINRLFSIADADIYRQYKNLQLEIHETLRTTGIFAEKGDDYMLDYFAPRSVFVLGREDRWLYVTTDKEQEPKWIYLDFVPPVTELDELLSPFGSSLSVYFENVESGFVYRYNAERSYLSASLPKAAFALYIYQKAERDEADLSQYLTFYSRDFDAWSSPIMSTRHRAGQTFPQRQLVEWNISYSDNIATSIIERTHGFEGFREFIADIGGSPEDVSGYRLVRSQITADEVGLWAREIYHYMESEESRYNEEFKSFMLNNQFPFIVSDYPVASKTGWTPPHAWHDMAIVYSPSPYILVILSTNRWGTEADHRVFQEISMAFQEFNNKWFVGGVAPIVDD